MNSDLNQQGSIFHNQVDRVPKVVDSPIPPQNQAAGFSATTNRRGMHRALAWDDWGGLGRFNLFTLWISVCIYQGVMSTMYVFCTNSLLGICWCLNACLLLVSWRSKCRIQNSEYPQMTYLIYCRSWLLAQSQLATTERHRPLYITKAQECFLLQPPLAFLSLFFPEDGSNWKNHLTSYI